MPRKRHCKTLSSYHGRLFNDPDSAQEWLDRMRRKMGPDYTYHLVEKRLPDVEEQLWSAHFYKEIEI